MGGRATADLLKVSFRASVHTRKRGRILAGSAVSWDQAADRRVSYELFNKSKSKIPA